jgi:hypothetical protein
MLVANLRWPTPFNSPIYPVSREVFPMRVLYTAAASGIVALATVSGASAQSITPASVNATMSVGQTLIINKTITLGATGASLVDLFFLADNTGSMGAVVNSAKTGAATIMANLPAGANYNFGVGRYLGDPSEPGVTLATAYTRQQDLTSSSADANTAINAWFASGGGDFPEANFYALQQVANTTSWRPGSQRLVIWFGDAPSHTATTTQAQAIAALNAAGATVIAFNSLSSGSGIDQGGQATAVAAGTGGTLTNNFTGADFAAIVGAQISTATSSLDLVFGSTFVGTGLTLEFFCTDALGCDGVTGGESRDFQLHITANQVGVYDFEVFASGVDAREFDSITVVDTSVVPEPSTWALFGTGLLGLGLMAWRRREDEPVA